MLLGKHLSYSLVSASALDGSGTVCAYGETVNRDGINERDIGSAVMLACERLADTVPDEDMVLVIVRFSNDT